MNPLTKAKPLQSQTLLTPEQLAYFDSPGAAQDAEALADSMLALLATIRAEDLEGLPTDLAAQHDHYLHGLPKRKE